MLAVPNVEQSRLPVIDDENEPACIVSLAGNSGPKYFYLTLFEHPFVNSLYVLKQLRTYVCNKFFKSWASNVLAAKRQRREELFSQPLTLMALTHMVKKERSKDCLRLRVFV